MVITDVRREARYRVPRVVHLLAKSKRISDRQLAEHLGLSRSSVQQRLAGLIRFNDGDLAVLAHVLGVDVCEFFDPKWDPVIGRSDEERNVTVGSHTRFVNLADLLVAA